MSILFVIILNVMFTSNVVSDVPPIICGYTGADGSYEFTYEFKIDEVPPRCTDIFYGGYDFDETPTSKETADIAIIKKANKPVWMMYMCPDTKELAQVACSKDPSALDEFIGSMVKYLKDNKIDGVILALLNLHAGEIPDYANVVDALICRIKKCVPCIKICIELDSSESDKFPDKNIFDFSVINDKVDLYAVDLSTATRDCAPNQAAIGGKQPIKSCNPNDTSLEQVWKGISCSAVDQCKLVAYALDYTINSKALMKTYTDYCARTGSDYWCADSIQIVYDVTTFLKQYFKGLIIIYVDVDDYDNTCGCGQFPIANTIMDAWEGKAMKSCPKLC